MGHSIDRRDNTTLRQLYSNRRRHNRATCDTFDTRTATTHATPLSVWSSRLKRRQGVVSASDVPVLRVYATTHPKNENAENGRARIQLVQLGFRSRLFSPYDAKLTSAGFGERAPREIGARCHKACFVPAMVGPFLKMTLVRETELRKATLPIFFDMMDCEQAARGNFQQVESELIDKLDILVSESSGDDEYRQLFHTILLEKVRCNEPVWKENGVSFISSITRLLERLLDYRNVVEGAENRDKRMSCTVNLLKFYRSEIQRQEMYVRYVYKLCDLHLPAENFTEAAFTLKLHADLLSWSGDPLPADEKHREQPQWQRKEALYLRILKYFDEGKARTHLPKRGCWEEGIPLCKELAELYEKRLFNYEKLSSILKMQAQFLDNILTQLRPEPEYFRVGFYGLGFPVFLRNKVFVYRGLEYEKVVAFTQRMQSQFPQAQLLTKNAPPDIDILGSDEQHLQICSVKPLPERRPEFEGREVPDKVLNYYLVNDVRMFQFDRPIHKEPIDKDNEFKSLWIERTTLETEERLPGVLPWQAVVHQRLQEVPPLVHACESVEAMNQELRRLVALFSREPSRGIAPLSMRLAGVIEAAVNGGIAKYQEAFFGPRFALDHPEQAPHIARLKALILDKVHILEGGLSLHGRLAPPEVLPLQRRLVDRFVIMKQSVREAASPGSRGSPGAESRRPSILSSPLPPVPPGGTGKRPPSCEPCGSTRSSSSGSSVYGQLLLLPEDSDDCIYSRLKEEPGGGEGRPLAAPPIPSRPRSVSLTAPDQKEEPGGGEGRPLAAPPIPSRPRSVSLTAPDQKLSLAEQQTGRASSHRRERSDGSSHAFYSSPTARPGSEHHNSLLREHREEACPPPLPPRGPIVPNSAKGGTLAGRVAAASRTSFQLSLAEQQTGRASSHRRERSDGSSHAFYSSPTARPGSEHHNSLLREHREEACPPPLPPRGNSPSLTS
ncbi:hypothetical protein HPB47_011427 [Ixodes persulcatus]|uniref:Uncharacterized protein n=1 Tax=Ixodes persulcatus TaxID=34615 RepID=A0AC60NWB2_IXOPE|nr:hypothetical protein HPB47_011427 [Ixodes persulcatus]